MSEEFEDSFDQLNSIFSHIDSNDSETLRRTALRWLFLILKEHNERGMGCNVALELMDALARLEFGRHHPMLKLPKNVPHAASKSVISSLVDADVLASVEALVRQGEKISKAVRFVSVCFIIPEEKIKNLRKKVNHEISFPPSERKKYLLTIKAMETNLIELAKICEEVDPINSLKCYIICLAKIRKPLNPILKKVP
jgi:hypothetical protein